MSTDNEISHTYRTKVVGVTHKNSDGKSRQMLVSRLKRNQVLSLVRELGNEFDKWAVAVLDTHGNQLVYLPAGDALCVEKSLCGSCAA